MEYLTFCPKYVALKQPGIFLTWETCYGWIAVCELFIFLMFLLIPKLPSRTGRVGREDPEIPNSPLSLFPPSLLFSQEPSPAVAERSAGSLAFCTVSSNVDDFQGWHYIWREPEGHWQMNWARGRVWCWTEEWEDVGRRESQGESLLHSAGCWHAMIPAVGNWDLCGYQQCRDRNVSLIILTRERERELQTSESGSPGPFTQHWALQLTTEADIKLPLSDASNSHLQFTTSIANTRWLCSVTSCYKLHS